jgi:DNA end-binding protein Ku
MREAGRVAVATFVLRTREYLAAVRPGGDALYLETLYYADEVRDARSLGISPGPDPAPRELAVALRLIESLTTEWDPSRYRDTYRERVLELIASRAGAAVPAAREPAEEPEAPLVPDLMAALQASLDAINKKDPSRARGKKRRTG